MCNAQKTLMTIKKKLKFGDLDLIVYELDNGEKLIDSQSMVEFIDYVEHGGSFLQEEFFELSKFIELSGTLN